jgi:hypothetical protein
MALNDPVSNEPDLDEAFESSPEFGIRYLNSEFREYVFRYIKRCGRGFFNYQDFEDVFQLTVRDLPKGDKARFLPASHVGHGTHHCPLGFPYPS